MGCWICRWVSACCCGLDGRVSRLRLSLHSCRRGSRAYGFGKPCSHLRLLPWLFQLALCVPYALPGEIKVGGKLHVTRMKCLFYKVVLREVWAFYGHQTRRCTRVILLTAIFVLKQVGQCIAGK